LSPRSPLMVRPILRRVVNLLTRTVRHGRPTRRPARGFARPRLEALEDRTLPSTVTWINPAGGNWSTPANWSTGKLPGLFDDVINVPGNVTITHSAGQDMVHSLTCEDNLVLSGGTLGLATASTIDGAFTMSNATLKGPGDLTLNGLFTWTGFGSMTGGGHTR